MVVICIIGHGSLAPYKLYPSHGNINRVTNNRSHIRTTYWSHISESYQCPVSWRGTERVSQYLETLRSMS